MNFSLSSELWYCLNDRYTLRIKFPTGILKPGEQNCLSSEPSGVKSIILNL